MIVNSSLSYISEFHSVGEKVFEMDEMGCLLPVKSNWVSTAPVAYFEASVLIWKGFVLSGIINTGSSVNHFLSSSNAF